MIDQRQTIATGFQVEQPSALLSWGATLTDVRDLLSTSVQAFRDGIVSAACTVLNGLDCKVLLHGPRGFGQDSMRDRLTMVSFWKQGDFQATFDEIQLHLELTFGPPHATIPGGDAWPAEYKWVIGDVIVSHYADDKGAGPQQRASIRKAL
ncbi:MAG: hypothetical protein M3O36_14805 [Myxococcota bacterium]|nr:hypothetical protein [Myxococcota bacterium]